MSVAAWNRKAFAAEVAAFLAAHPDVEAVDAFVVDVNGHALGKRVPVTDLATLAAAYAFGIAKAHAFTDGNKRAAFLTAMIFLGLNGKDLDATEAEVVQAMTALAAGSLSEPEMATWIRERLTRLKL